MVLEDYGCAICATGIEESVEHLFLRCLFAVQCWRTLGLNSTRNIEPLLLMEVFKSRLNVPFFMEIIILMCWSIWGSCNEYLESSAKF